MIHKYSLIRRLCLTVKNLPKKNKRSGESPLLWNSVWSAAFTCHEPALDKKTTSWILAFALPERVVKRQIQP
jgi:hypothetical protein